MINRADELQAMEAFPANRIYKCKPGEMYYGDGGITPHERARVIFNRTRKKFDGVIQPCLTCSKPIKRQPSDIKRGRRRFCSPKCKANSQTRSGKEVPCLQCGVVHYRTPDKLKNKRYFCSRDCYLKTVEA